MKNQRELFVLSRTKLLFFILLNPVLASVIYAGHETWWAWTQTTLSDQKVITVTDGIALVQFSLAAFTIDQLLRRIYVSFNRSLKQRVIPVFVIQLASLLVYGLVSVAAYLLLFDHSLTSLLAASGMISIGVGYFSKDLIQDVLMSIQIQADGLVSVNDWVHLHKMEEGGIYQIKEIDRRMTTLIGLNGYKQVIRNSVFYDMRIINLSRQEFGCMRQVEIDVDSQFSEEKILKILNLAIKCAKDNHKYFYSKSACRIKEVSPYRVTFLIEYHCHPSIKPSESDHEVRRTTLRFLRSAGLFEIGNLVMNLIDEPREMQKAVFANSGLERGSSNFSRLMGSVQYSFLSVLSQSDLIQLSESVRCFSLPVGQRLIAEGESGDSMFVISEGVLEVIFKNADSASANNLKLWPGDCVGEMSILTGEPRSADVCVSEHAVLFEIKKQDLLPILERDSALAESMAHQVLNRKNNLKNINYSDAHQNNTPVSLAKKILAFFKLG